MNSDNSNNTSYYRWVILALLCGLYAAFGLVNRAIAPLVTPILNDLHISYAQMGMILGAWQVAYIFVSLINGPIIDNWGIKKSLFSGALIVGLSAILRYYPVGFFSMLFAVAVFGIGGPMISIGGPKAIAVWFEDDSRSTAVGIFMAGSIAGGLAALSLTNSLVMPLTGQSWRLTFVCYGLFALLAALLWLIFSREKPFETEDEDAGLLDVFKLLLSIPRVCIILLMGLFSFGIFHGLGSWLPKILETSGLSPSLAGFAASVPSISSIPSIILIPRFVPAHLRGKAIALFAVVTALIVYVITTRVGVGLFAGLIFSGIFSAGFLPIMLLILMDTAEIGSKHMGAAGGMFFCVAEIGGVLGPFMMGGLMDLTGSFFSGTIFLMSLSVTVAFLAWFLPRKK